MATPEEQLAKLQQTMAKLQEEIALDRARKREQPPVRPGTTGWTVSVNTEKLARFKDAAMDARLHYYEACEQALDLWMEAQRSKRKAKHG
jgi:hypothetical protein